MRARLKCMRRGQEYSFICGVDMARRMDRVVFLAGGVIQTQDASSKGVVFRVMKRSGKKRIGERRIRKSRPPNKDSSLLNALSDIQRLSKFG